MSRPATPILQHIMLNAEPAGMRRVFKDMGIPADTLEMAFVNGMLYSRLRPLIGADKPPKKLPPAIVLKIAVRLHPEMRRRNKTAAKILAEHPWRDVVEHWETKGRAEVEQANLALQDVELGALTDDALLEHVRITIAHCEKHWELHFWMHGYDMGPIGLFLFDSQKWGLTPAELIPLLEGASPSTSEPVRMLARLRRAVEASGTTPKTFDELRAVSPEAAADLDRYLRYRGHVLFSRYDLDGVTLGEVPDVVLATVMHAEERDVGAEIEAKIAAVRERVPAADRAEFDSLVSEARAAMNLRDDNGPNTAEWPLGLMRMALLEVGRRMVRHGTAKEVEHAFELKVDELTPALFDNGGPGAVELARRADERDAFDVTEAPLVLGDAELAPPLDVMPKPLARLVGTVQLTIQQMGMDGTRHDDGLRGSGVGSQSYRGRARRADTPEEALDRMEPGDVLVVPCTTPAYNMVLGIAGGVVTSEGGPLSHAAVLARELGIPAVIGARTALIDIPDGAEVEIDPVAGRVTVLAAQ